MRQSTWLIWPALQTNWLTKDVIKIKFILTVNWRSNQQNVTTVDQMIHSLSFFFRHKQWWYHSLALVFVTHCFSISAQCSCWEEESSCTASVASDQSTGSKGWQVRNQVRKKRYKTRLWGSLQLPLKVCYFRNPALTKGRPGEMLRMEVKERKKWVQVTGLLW